MAHASAKEAETHKWSEVVVGRSNFPPDAEDALYNVVLTAPSYVKPRNNAWILSVLSAGGAVFRHLQRKLQGLQLLRQDAKASLRFLRYSSPPLHWVMDLTRINWIVLVSFISVYNLVVIIAKIVMESTCGLDHHHQTETFEHSDVLAMVPLEIIITAMGPLAVWCSSHSRGRYRLAELLMMGQLSVLYIVSIANIMHFSETEVLRQRRLASFAITFKCVTVLMNPRLGTGTIGLVVIHAAEAIAQMMAHIFFDDDMEAHSYTISMVTLLIFFVFLVVYNWRMRLLYWTQQKLKTEKEGCEMLISRLCLCTLWLGADSRTVVKCDRRFNTFCGRSMKGHQLKECILNSPSEQARLENAISEARHGPICFSTVVDSSLCGMTTCDFLIVDRRVARHHGHQHHAHGEHCRDCKHEPAILIGVRTHSDTEVKVVAAEAEELVKKEDQDGGDLHRSSDASKKSEATSTADDMKADSQEDKNGNESSGLSGISTRLFTKMDLVVRAQELHNHLENLTQAGMREHWLIDTSKVTIWSSCVLGCGGFATVVGAQLHGMPVAMKVPNSKKGQSIRLLPSLANELRILRRIRHPNIVLFHGACIDLEMGDLALVFEWVKGVPLGNFIDVQGPASKSLSLQLILDLACALRYLHSQSPPIVHGDLSASNVFVEWGSGMNHAKILDFGLSRLATRKAKPLGGTARWMAPELFRRPRVLPAASSDVYSYGRLMHFMITGVKPYSPFENHVIVEQVLTGYVENYAWPDVTCFSVSCQLLCSGCGALDPGLRPDIKSLHECFLAEQPPSEWSSQSFGEALSPRTRLVNMQAGLPSPWRVGLKELRTEMEALSELHDMQRNMPKEAYVTLDAFDPNLRVAQASEGWERLFGTANGEPVDQKNISFLAGARREKFISWLQTWTNNMLSGQWAPDKTTVNFAKMRGSLTGTMAVEATVAVTFPDPSSMNEECGQYMVTLSLLNIQVLALQQDPPPNSKKLAEDRCEAPVDMASLKACTECQEHPLSGWPAKMQI
mmetsp:Transcript_66676/g.159396  ORF Transcript_66676/g.159396 Transcript_66676/m.159396 type:complete len:1017 (-) Transcript_66676:57-3107(-)